MSPNNGASTGTGGNASRRVWITVAIITVFNIYAFIDRAIMSLLVEPIKADLGLSDTQIGLLLGAAFVVFYSIANIPAGYLVDRVNRRMVVGFSCAIWSSVTAISGFAQNFVHLFAGRAGVGLAESTIAPSAFSLIRDQVPPESRGRAFSVLAAGPFIGSAVSLMIGGAILAMAAKGVFANMPVLGDLSGWQIVLLLVGLTGLPLSLLAFFITEPRTGARARQASVSFREAFDFMWQKRATYGLLIAYATTCGMLALGKSAWIPAMMGRNYGLTAAEVGPMLGVINITAAPIGVVLGGFVIDKLAATGQDIRLYGLVAAVLAATGMTLLPLMPTIQGAWVMFGFQAAFAGAFYTVGATTLAEITPERIMGRVTASYLLVQNIIGQAFGPLIIAVLSDTWFRSQGRFAIGYSISSVGAFVGALSVVFVILLMANLRQVKLAAASA